MAPVRTLKARAHHGASSLDLTVPADLCREFAVRPGDVFRVEVDGDGDDLVLRYTRILRRE